MNLFHVAALEVNAFVASIVPYLKLDFFEQNHHTLCQVVSNVVSPENILLVTFIIRGCSYMMSSILGPHLVIICHILFDLLDSENILKTLFVS